ncbi:MAG: hydrogenase iron-sulfur subunit [Proteobacteria bacterium]|nr:hydrogenase iron-sulfur subunit [Pseudomonadota bacterium]
MPPAKAASPAVVSLENCNGCARCFQDCPFSAITMAPRSDGQAYAVEAVVNIDNCVSCGICVGACPTATPFRRNSAIVPGIELPDFSIADLRKRTMAATADKQGNTRILVYACEHSGAESLQGPDATVITMPCVGMLPPSFIDFALSRSYADGVMLAGCAEGDCYYRLGNEWTQQRVDGTRDPYLRRRVARERLAVSWLPGKSGRQKQVLAEFIARLRALPAPSKERRSDRA